MQIIGLRTAGNLHAAGTGDLTMWEDPIVKETRQAREQLSAQFGDDLAALCEFLREKELEHPERLVTLAPRHPEIVESSK